MTGLNLSKTLLAANNIVPSPAEKKPPKVSFTSHSSISNRMYSSISIMCFYINNKSGKLDENYNGTKLLTPYQIRVVTATLKSNDNKFEMENMKNMTGKSTTYLAAIHAQAIECGRSKL